MNRRHYAITLQQASAESPTLAMLTALTKDSSERLKAIEPLLPAGLRTDTVRAGPIRRCYLVPSGQKQLSSSQAAANTACTAGSFANQGVGG